MFRRVENTLEPDPSFSADLKQLGYFVNNIGQIRMIEAPEKHYVYNATNNERVNEVLREAMRTCQRNETEERLAALGLNRIYFPGFSTTKPDGPHVSIVAPSKEVLKKRKRVIVLVNDASQDLGILAYQPLLGINGGSVVNFVKEILKRSAADGSVEHHEAVSADGFKLEDDSTTPALVVLNTGQLLYSHKHNRAMTMQSWSAMPRKSVVHDMIRIHDVENRVPGHRNPEEHIKSVFDNVLCNPECVSSGAEVYVIAIENGTESILNLLAEDFEKYGSRITAMALVHSLVDDSQIKSPSLRAFLRQRSRQWKHSDLTSDPLHCICIPENCNEQSDHTTSPTTSLAMHPSAQRICWHDNISTPGPLSTVTRALHRLVLAITTDKEKDDALVAPESHNEWSNGQTVICPTFAGGDLAIGEHVFTNTAVQHAILSFFEEVAQDPEYYRNPNFKIYTDAPQPSVHEPLVLSADDTNDYILQPLPAEMSPLQEDVNEAHRRLTEMKAALAACPTDVQELQKGRQRLESKIKTQTVIVDDLEAKTLATGGLKAGEAQEKRENWKPKTEGPKVPFAGSMVDIELLKAAGLVDTAYGELKKLGEDEDEKAFL